MRACRCRRRCGAPTRRRPADRRLWRGRPAVPARRAPAAVRWSSSPTHLAAVGLLISRGELPSFLVERVLTVETAVLLHLDALAVVRLVLHRDVVAPLADLAGEGHLDPLVTCHRSLL